MTFLSDVRRILSYRREFHVTSATTWLYLLATLQRLGQSLQYHFYLYPSELPFGRNVHRISLRALNSFSPIRDSNFFCRETRLLSTVAITTPWLFSVENETKYLSTMEGKACFMWIKLGIAEMPSLAFLNGRNVYQIIFY